MRKKVLVCLLAVAWCAGVQGQTPTKRIEIQRPAVATAVQPNRIPVDPKTMLEAQVNVLKHQVQELKKQINLLMAEANKAKANVPHCSADYKASSSALGSRDCWPYTCDNVSGACFQACATSNDCQGGTNCCIRAGAVGECTSVCN